MDDHHLTTFITKNGHYSNQVTHQGYVATGDSYNKWYNNLIASMLKTKCINDITWDETLEEHWWRTINYLELVSNNGIILNPEKFQFCQ
jgi:hypothetical protein